MFWIAEQGTSSDLTQVYCRDYYENSVISNYKNYNDRCYDNLAHRLITECNMEKDDSIIDYGCATGLLIYSFKKYGFTRLNGTDISNWAIENGRNKFKLTSELHYFDRNLLSNNKDWLIALDVLEHIPTLEELIFTLRIIKNGKNRKGLIVRIPVSKNEGENFYLEVSRVDKTHYQAHSKQWWLQLFASFGLHPVKFFDKKPEIWDSDGVLAVWLQET